MSSYPILIMPNIVQMLCGGCSLCAVGVECSTQSKVGLIKHERYANSSDNWVHWFDMSG